jgi:hypothetical protein
MVKRCKARGDKLLKPITWIVLDLVAFAEVFYFDGDVGRSCFGQFNWVHGIRLYACPGKISVVLALCDLQWVTHNIIIKNLSGS